MKQQQPERNYQQEIFYRAKDGLLKQGRKCNMHKNRYPLIDEEGNRCALGFLLPDNLGLTFTANIFSVAENLNIPSYEFEKVISLNLTHELQHLHDDVPVIKWEFRFDWIQEKFNIPDCKYETTTTSKKLFTRSILPF